MARSLQLLPVPAGDAVLDLLPRLARALAGDGPALLPVPAAEPARAARIATDLNAGASLTAVEDDPADPTALVVPTSGSTGSSKGVLLPAGALRASALATHRRLFGHGPPRGRPAPPPQWLLTLPAHHIAGLQVLLRALAAGTAPTVLDTTASFTPERFTDAVGRLPPGPRYVSLVPTQLRRVLDDPEATAALTTFTSVLVGGSATPPALVDAAMAAGIPLVRTYGMTETSAGCVYDGIPLDGLTVTTGPTGRADDPGRPGRIQLIGAVVARGYRGLPGHPAFFVDHDTGRRGFRTDDLGVLADGRWRILGRVDDVIVSGGANVAPAAVEATLSTVPGVGDVVVVGIPDPEWGELVVAVVVPAAGRPPEMNALRAAARERHGIAAAPRALILVADLPLRGPGKHDRSAVRALARSALPEAALPEASLSSDGHRVVDARSARVHR